MLTFSRNTSRSQTCYDNIVDKSRKRGHAADEESDDSTPVRSILGRISIYSVEVVHIWYRNIAASDDEVAVKNGSVNYRRGGRESWVTNSVMRIDVIGPKNMVYPPRNARNLAADARIFHGTNAQLPMTAASSWPLRMLMYFGQNAIKSLAALIEFAEILIPRVTMIKPIAAKAAAARPP